MCHQCGAATDEEDLHPCPFKEDVHGDSSEVCNCCPECTQHCLEDI